MKFICLQKIENIEKDQIVDTADDFQKWAVEHYPNNFKPYEQAALKEQDAEPSEAIKPEPEKEPEKESKKPERGRPKKWQRR